MNGLVKKLSDDEVKGITTYGKGNDSICGNYYLIVMCSTIGWKYDSGSCSYLWSNCGGSGSGGGGSCGTCTCR